MYHSGMRLILASASPRRAALLRAAGYEFDVDPAHVDESELAGRSAAAYVVRVAPYKARTVAARHPDDVVLAADTTVVVDGVMLGKPRRRCRRGANAEAAVRPDARGADGRGRHPGGPRAVAIACPPGCGSSPSAPPTSPGTSSSGEPHDKAGAYGVRGWPPGSSSRSRVPTATSSACRSPPRRRCSTPLGSSARPRESEALDRAPAV